MPKAELTTRDHKGTEAFVSLNLHMGLSWACGASNKKNLTANAGVVRDMDLSTGE